MPQTKHIEIAGIPIVPGGLLDKIVPRDPGIWDEDGCCGGSERHIARLPDGTLFDLGNAGATKHLCHIFADGRDTFQHHPVDQLEIVTPPEDVPVARHHAWLEARNYARE
ncbi:MAG: hypothetical protein WCT33_02935 [Patescibacteria group bacterium]|jgi:hypothetical protein